MMQVSDGTLGQGSSVLATLTNGSFPQAESEPSATEGCGDRRGGVYGKCRQPGCCSGWHRDLDVHGAQNRFYASTAKSLLKIY